MQTPDYGRRLLPSLIDEIAATDPDRVFLSIPRTADIQDGFQDISFQRLAKAIDRCAWWLEQLLERGKGFPTVAYMGPHDARYLILTFACSKTGLKVRCDSVPSSFPYLLLPVILTLAAKQHRRPPGVAEYSQM